MTPAEVLIKEMGGVRPAQRMIARHGLELTPSCISRWKSRGEGMIPSRYLPFLVDVAERENLNMTMDELVRGR